MTVTPTGEPGRYFVSSETDDLPWLVDLFPGHDMPNCACAIEHSRTLRNWRCKHVIAVAAFLRTCPPAPPVAVSEA
jgi:hypothetical protein